LSVPSFIPPEQVILDEMRFYEWLTVGFFLLFAVLAFFPRYSSKRRNTIAGIAGAGVALVMIGGGIVRDWLPVVLLPMAYWQTGLFVRPLDKTWQLRLQRFDRSILPWFAGLPRFLMTAFEFAYLLCYPMVPLGLIALYWAGQEGLVEAFWNVVVPPAYVCYATFPFIQTLPPRALEDVSVWQPPRTQLRILNLFVLRHVTTQANTFPSGHVAASLAIALVLLTAMPVAGIVFLMMAVGIAAGAFLGRYHYALDVAIGAALAVISFVVAPR
jgi:membrane-associated phospholipid phosphatase